jgi:hypothetical protein
MWTTLQFGKHSGKSLPQIVIDDPDWFFWARRERVFGDPWLIREADDLAYKAAHIKIPRPDPDNWRCEYIFEADWRFVRCDIVEADRPVHVGSSVRLRAPHFDLTYVRRLKSCCRKGDYRRLLRDFRSCFFKAKSARLTQGACEQFFGNEANFVRVPDDRWACPRYARG